MEKRRIFFSKISDLRYKSRYNGKNPREPRSYTNDVLPSSGRIFAATYRLGIPLLFRKYQVVVKFLEADALEDAFGVIG